MQVIDVDTLMKLGYSAIDLSDNKAVSAFAATCFDTSQAVYEQSIPYLLGYLAGAGSLILVRGYGNVVPILFRESSVDIPYPLISDNPSFETLCAALQGLGPVRICYLSEHQADEIASSISLPFLRLLHSPREVHYSTFLLNRLPGKHFASLRSLRNGSGRDRSLTFKEDGEVSLQDLQLIQLQWNKTRKTAYAADRTEKELGFFSQILERPKEASFIVAYIEGKPRGFAIILQSARKEEGLLQVKSVNGVENGSLRSLSGILYLSAAKRADFMGLSYLNDGDLGAEEGSIAHKLSLRPDFETRTWDLHLIQI